MAFLRDLALVQEATEIPALRERVREEVVRALFVRDERALPRDVVRVLSRGPDVVARVRDELDVRQAVRVANGEETTINLGRPADEFHHYRHALSVAKDQTWGVTTAPRRLLTYDWMVPPQGGIRVDLSDLDAVEVDVINLTARVGAGATWKALYDRARELDRLPAVFPTVPIDFALADGILGDAVFRSYAHSFASAVYDVRGLAANGLRVNCGYEQVPNHGTGYNLRDLATQFGEEFLVPTYLWTRLTPAPEGFKNLAFGFEERDALATAVDRLVSTGRPWIWANVYDERSWGMLGARDSPGPFVLEVGFGGTEALIASRTKALEAAVEGFTAKGEGPTPWDLSPESYAARSENLERLLFVGEVVATAGQLGAAAEAIASVAAAKGLLGGFFGTIRQTGQVYLATHVEAAKERAQVYDVSRTLSDRLRAVSNTFLDSRLAALWDTSPPYQNRLEILQRLLGALDMPGSIEPPATLEPEAVELFPGGVG